ncbi:TM252 protein, partial [Urocolius indicus]|nr:TM252 protein [Urocolius indicus]
KMPTHVSTFLRILLLFLSVSFFCLGVICISLSSFQDYNEVLFYCLLFLGFFFLVIGIFWNTLHEVLKCSGFSSTLIGNRSLREPRVSTIDRPDFYPPSYEESTDPEKQTFPLPVVSTLKQQEVIHIPPPLYSESSTEFISETNEQEQPPSYELCVQQLQQQEIADQVSHAEEDSNSHPSTQQNSH